MPYVPTDWADDITPVDAAHMDHIEQGIVDAHAALDAKQATSQKGQANGYAGLDATGKVPVTQLPPLGYFERLITRYRTSQGGVEMFPPFIATVNRTLGSGTCYAFYFDPTAAEQARLPTIRSIEVVCSQAPTGLTLGQFAIWRASDGVLLANTADWSATPPTPAQFNKPLVTPLPMPTVPFYVGFFGTWTGTAIGLAATNTAGGAGASVSHGPAPGIYQTGLSALPNPIVATSGASYICWFGLFS